MIDRLLKNATWSLTEIPTGLEALYALPPGVIQSFWKLTRAATNALHQANRVGAAPDCERVLASALDLFCHTMDLTTRPRPEAPSNGRQALAGLDEILARHYLPETLTLMSRVLAYNERMLHALAESPDPARRPHPLFVMDLNMLFNAFERLTGYVPATECVSNAPTAFPLPETQNAADWDTLYLLRGIAGDPATWRPANGYSEFNMLNAIAGDGSPEKSRDAGRNSSELRKYLQWVWAGARDCDVDALNLWQAQAWKDKEINPSRKLPQNSGFDDSESKEMWFYINGVVTDHWLAQINAECLANLFQRPVHILHNPTDGLHRDLIECVRGRTIQDTTAVALRVLGEMIRHLAAGKGAKKVVVIAHSQGTIITAELVRRMTDRRILERMEVFNFAFCADDFPTGAVRHVEHFANEHDLVGLLSIKPGEQDRIPYGAPGTVYARPGAWGHFLNAHYLDCFPSGAYRDENGSSGSVLYQYLGGKHYGQVIHES